MKIGLYWYDNSKSPLIEKLEGAVSYYKEKYGKEPTLAMVNPKDNTIGLYNCNGVIIENSKSIQINHIWIGIGE
jgi:hypothetical protein